MMSPGQTPEDRRSPQHFRHTPLQIIHVVGNFMRIWSIYSLYRYLTQTGASVVLFLFTCLVPASILFLVLQKPWKGRPLSNAQVVPSIINGAITALYFILWGKGLKSCGPLRNLFYSSFPFHIRAILAEYSGAVLGVLSAVLYGRRGHVWKKHFLAKVQYKRYSSLFSLSPDPEVETEEVLGMTEMVVPIIAGVLSALRRVIARRVSLKNQLKRRLNAITMASATCFLFPVAMWDMIIGSPSSSEKMPFSIWPFLSTILFGVILIFYIDSIAEEKLHMVFSSPRHLMVAGGCIIIMEIVYKMDFSLAGFLICCFLLGFVIIGSSCTSLATLLAAFVAQMSVLLLPDVLPSSGLAILLQHIVGDQAVLDMTRTARNFISHSSTSA
ncbi:hypothetical protein TIFTF001_001919 [Ficus carica]|uniref:Uncharacterized protein n=1 Tax=Ficus carica TaxID=3494 RepID=A0AA88D5Z7_FICCA|nr:hypothetical protein TIFTF001_001919 [Ficus carica]